MKDEYYIKRLFDRAHNDLLCNTSYPYKPNYFNEYESNLDIMEGIDALSIYFHIPFCNSLCRFCEYTRFLYDNSSEDLYLDILERQVKDYFINHKINKCYGIDIGGGTPSCLSANGLKRVLDIITKIKKSCTLVKDFESSFEFNYESITPDKISIIGSYGISRVSTGIQVYSNDLMKKYNRETANLQQMIEYNRLFKQAGVKKINIDLMYGFIEQSPQMFDNSLKIIELLHPEHVTLYEMRYNQNYFKFKNLTKKKLYNDYSYLYNGLTSIGYNARFGQNTFSIYDDEGISSYLKYRMKYNIPYKGFGIAAQSMTNKGISYNRLKLSKEKKMPNLDKIDIEYNYYLPPEEIVGKYVSIAMYNASFDLKVISKILGIDSKDYYYNELNFLLQKELIEVNNDKVILSTKGFKYYGAIAALFWSNEAKKTYLDNYEY